MKNEKLLDAKRTATTWSVRSGKPPPQAYQLSTLLNDEVSHDSVQRFLAVEEQTSADLWHKVKPHVRKVESAEGVLIVDDSIGEKPYTDENDIICWHSDHSKQRHIKGLNFCCTMATAVIFEQSKDAGR